MRILDRYRLIERLAAGGTAEVWRAHDEQLDRPVAVKRLHAHLLPDAASRSRLAAEARAAAGLSHPVIVGIYDVDVEGDAPSLVMELVEGESLAERIARDGPLPATEAALLGAEVADALFHAHQRGVIHRDVKPGNVLLARDGGVRLVDFGIAHSLADAAQRLTQTGTVIGTLSSMAPEQLAAGPITPRTDLYGLGVVLYEALTARAPHESSTPLVLAEAQRAGPPPLEGVDPRFAAIVASCLAYDPANRPLHAGALAEALRDWAAGGATTVQAAPVAALPAQDGEPTVTVPRPEAAASSGVGAPPASRRRTGAAWLPWLLAGGAGILVAAWLALGGPAAFDDVAGVSPTPVPTPTAEPTPVPDWAAELAAEVAAACGEDALTADELAAMGKDDAKDHADATIEACEDDDDGDNGRGRGGGNNGGGNGNRGRGNGD